MWLYYLYLNAFFQFGLLPCFTGFLLTKFEIVLLRFVIVLSSFNQFHCSYLTPFN